jgi:hypothetical protein
MRCDYNEPPRLGVGEGMRGVSTDRREGVMDRRSAQDQKFLKPCLWEFIMT